MGCDIHAYIEQRKYDGWWLFASIKMTRDYKIFGLLAGVRGDLEPIVQPRGIPDDLSIGVRNEYSPNKIGNSEWHTPSWLTADELAKIVFSYDGLNREIVAIASMVDILDEARLVFWFDN